MHIYSGALPPPGMLLPLELLTFCMALGSSFVLMLCCAVGIIAFWTGTVGDLVQVAVRVVPMHSNRCDTL